MCSSNSLATRGVTRNLIFILIFILPRLQLTILIFLLNFSTQPCVFLLNTSLHFGKLCVIAPRKKFKNVKHFEVYVWTANAFEGQVIMPLAAVKLAFVCLALRRLIIRNHIQVQKK